MGDHILLNHLPVYVKSRRNGTGVSLSNYYYEGFWLKMKHKFRLTRTRLMNDHILSN